MSRISMEKKLYDFLCSVYGQDKVSLVYSDKVTAKGLSIYYYCDNVDFDKELDGTTNLKIGTFTVEIWHDSLIEVLESSDILINAAEGTDFQIQNLRPTREDGYKRKWHRVIQIRIMEDFKNGTDI